MRGQIHKKFTISSHPINTPAAHRRYATAYPRPIPFTDKSDRSPITVCRQFATVRRANLTALGKYA